MCVCVCVFVQRCEESSDNVYMQEVAFCQPECKLPEGRTMVLAGFKRSNSSSIERDRPYFRSDGRHDCFVDQVSTCACACGANFGADKKPYRPLDPVKSIFVMDFRTPAL